MSLSNDGDSGRRRAAPRRTNALASEKGQQCGGAPSCAAKRDGPPSLKRAKRMVTLPMFRPIFRRTIIAALLAAAHRRLAQPVAAPDCTVDGVLADSDGLKLEITYRCRATQPLTFQPGEDRASPYVSGLKVEQRDGWPRRTIASTSRATPAPSIRRRSR